MKINSNFSGRIIQLTDALDYGDAVSNQVIALDAAFKRLGLRAEIYSKWHHEKVAAHRRDLSELVAREDDVVILHFFGLSEHALPAALECYATRILLTHNITPASFFDSDTSLHAFCLKGREQLRQVWSKFHFFWGDSDYNLEELRTLGVPAERCSVVPIIVAPIELGELIQHPRERGSWLFVGRVAPNKQHLQLVDLFAKARLKNPEAATRMYFVGSFDPTDPYARAVQQTIQRYGLTDVVQLTGKVSDAERDAIYARASVFVSLSLHEGFGVPLVEASHRGVPAVALESSAVGETLRVSQALASSPEAVGALAVKAVTDPVFAASLIQAQRKNAGRFLPAAVLAAVRTALGQVLPVRRHYRTLSVVICTYNRRDFLARVLDYLSYQTCSQFEVVIVDGPSDDGTKVLLESFRGAIKIAHNPERNLSKSRNIGIELSTGDIVAFIDDDALPFDDWVENILAAYNSHPLTVTGMGGPTFYAGSLKFQATDIAFNKLAEAKVNVDSAEIGKDGWYRSLLGTNATFTREALMRTDGFDEQYDYFLDESEVCWHMQSANALIGYCENIFLRHEFAQSANRQSKHNFNWYTICKNTAYFIAAYSGLKGKKLDEYLRERMQRERIAPLDAAVQAGEITRKERDNHVQNIWKGTDQGLLDLQHFPRRRHLKSTGGQFLPFACSASRLRIGHEIRRLHVCIVSKEFPPFASRGGIGTLYYHLASELLLMGHEVTVIVPADEPHEFKQGRFRVLYAQRIKATLDHLDSGFANNINWSLSALTALTELHSHHSVDVLETALWDTEALAIAMVPSENRPPLVVRLVTPFPVAARLNGWQVPEQTATCFKSAEQELIAHADALVPISDSIQKTIQREYALVPDDRWTIVPCGISYWPAFSFEQGYANIDEIKHIFPEDVGSGKLVVFVGRLEQRKGIDLVLQAASEFLAADKGVQLLIAGWDVEGWAQRLPEMVEAQLCKRIHFLGEVSDATREKLFAHAYCVLFPSRYESFGLVPLEAFVHGTPVIASYSGAIPEVVTIDSGILFQPDDAGALARAVVQLVREPELRQRLSIGARNRVRTLSSRRMAERSVELYATLCN